MPPTTAVVLCLAFAFATVGLAAPAASATVAPDPGTVVLGPNCKATSTSAAGRTIPS